MIDLLRQVPAHGTQAVRLAIESALACGSGDSGTVLLLLSPGRLAAHPVIQISGSGSNFERPLPALDLYDSLLHATGGTEVRQ
jgi:hypothetical protein